MTFIGLRFFTVYGPWGRPDMAVYHFALSMVKGDMFNVFQTSDGDELSRDFTYVGDIVSGIVSAVKNAPPSEQGLAVNEVYNLGNRDTKTVSDLVHTLEFHLNLTAKEKVTIVPNLGEVKATFANITKAHEMLSYNPTVGLGDGVSRFCIWFKQFYASGFDQGGSIPLDWLYTPM